MVIASRSFWTKFLIVVLVVCVAIPGLNAYLNNSDANVVATVGNTKIYVNEYNRAYEEEMLYMQNVLHIPLTREQMEAWGFRKAVLNKIIERKLMDNWVDELNLVIGENSVINAIKSIKVFHLADGGFDEEKFNSFLKQVGLNQRNFYKMVSQDILREMLLKPFFSFDANDYPVLSHDMNRYFYQSRVVDIVNFNSSMVGKLPDPNLEDLKQIYDDNQEKFYSPELRKVAYIKVGKEHLKTTVEVTDADFSAAMENLLLGQQAIFRYKTFDSKEKAVQWRSNVEDSQISVDWDLAGADFDDFYTELKPLFDSMQLRQLTDVVDLEGAFYVFYLEDKLGSNSIRMQEHIENIKKGLHADKLKVILRDLMEQVESGLERGDTSFAEVARKYGVFFGETDLIAFQDVPSNLAKSASLIFSSEVDIASGFVEDDEAFVNFLVTDVQPSQLQSLEIVIDLLKSIWATQYKNNFLKSKLRL